MSLTLDLLRHGEAERDSVNGDAGRRLTPAGVAGLERVARRLQDMGWKPDRAYTSPLVRAYESTRVVLGTAGVDLTAETLDDLAGDRTPREVLDALTRLGAAAGTVLLVGHQPLLGDLVTELTGAAGAIAPGTFVRVECPGGSARGGGRVALVVTP